jgi:hypothetical protein
MNDKSPQVPERLRAFVPEEIGDDVLSHRVAPAVPSALWGLTSEFGMGSGGSPMLESPIIEIGRG